MLAKQPEPTEESRKRPCAILYGTVRSEEGTFQRDQRQCPEEYKRGIVSRHQASGGYQRCQRQE